MAFTAADVIAKASTLLLDGDAVRWTAQELRGYLNDALRELVALKPTAKTATVNLTLAAGCKQALPAEYTVLSRVICNRITGNSRAIQRLENADIMDAVIPGWQHPSFLPYSAAVASVIHDLADPRTFYVVPGNTGDGIIEAVVGRMPAQIPVPGANPDLVASYTTAVDVPDIYQNALVDYVMYRSYSKDSGAPNAAARAVAHFQAFQNGVNQFTTAETSLSLAAQAATTT